MRESRNAWSILGKTPLAKCPLRTPIRRRKDIKMKLRRTGCEDGRRMEMVRWYWWCSGQVQLYFGMFYEYLMARGHPTSSYHQ
jgi:hypothetical protein